MMHDIYTIGIPLFAILAGILFNAQQGKELRGEIRDLRVEMNGMRSDIHADLRALNQIAFAHEQRLAKVEERKP